MAVAGSIEPLNSQIWFGRIELIAGATLPLENALRHASHLLQLAPTQFRNVLRLAIDEDSFEALLDAGDFDAAARHLVAQPTSLSVTHGASGSMVSAEISCVVLKRVIQGTGKSEADAILDAWASCVLALKDQFGADLSKLSPTADPVIWIAARG